MLKRTYTPTHSPSLKVALESAGVLQNGCSVLVAARLRAKITGEGIITTIAKIVPEMEQHIPSFRREHGSVRVWDMEKVIRLATDAPFYCADVEKMTTQPKERSVSAGMGYYFRATPQPKRVWPTVAAWLRENPSVISAVIITRGHTALIQRGSVYAASARHRVRHAWILEEQEQDQVIAGMRFEAEQHDHCRTALKEAGL